MNGRRPKLVARPTTAAVSVVAPTMLLNLGAEAVGVDLVGVLRG